MDGTTTQEWTERGLERREEDPVGEEFRKSLSHAPVVLQETRTQREAPGVDRPPPSVLLVEDNPGDVRLVCEAFATGSVQLRLTIAQDGLEALNMLRHSGRRPDLILLDLNLPMLDGRSLLRRIKADPQLLRIPVIVLTSSDAPQDVCGAYDLHANCYLVKPADYAGLERSLHDLIHFWAGIAYLPSN